MSIINRVVLYIHTSKKGWFFNSSASPAPPPSLFRGSLISSLEMKSAVEGERFSGMGGSVLSMRLNNNTAKITTSSQT